MFAVGIHTALFGAPGPRLTRTLMFSTGSYTYRRDGDQQEINTFVFVALVLCC